MMQIGESGSLFKQNDTATTSSFQAKAEALFEDRDALGKKLGAPACAGEQA